MYAIADSVLRQLDRELAAPPPENGGALLGLPGRPVVTAFVLDDTARTTSVSYLPSDELVRLVPEIQVREGLAFHGISHSHTPTMPRPSGPDIDEAAQHLARNPNLPAFLHAIVTGHGSRGEPGRHELALPSGRVSLFTVRRLRSGGTGPAEPVSAHSIPLMRDLDRLAGSFGQEASPESFVHVHAGRTSLAGSLNLPGGVTLMLVVPDDYPLGAPTAILAGPEGSTHAAPLRWDLGVADEDRLLRAFEDLIAPPGPFRRGFGPAGGPSLTADPGVASKAGWSERWSADDPAVERRRLRSALLSRRPAGDVGFAWARALVVGCGSVGSYVADTIARVGLGRITLVDPEDVAAPDRAKAIYTAADRGPKVDALARRLMNIDPGLDVVPVQSAVAELGAERLNGLVSGADIVFAATDDLDAQRTIDRFAYARGRPAVFAALYAGAEGGEVIFTNPPSSVCYTCATASRHGIAAATPSPDLGATDYGTGRLSAEPALAVDIHRAAGAAVKIGLGLLARDRGIEATGLAEFLDSPIADGATYATFGMVERFWFYPEIFSAVPGQYAFQALWLVPTRREDCPACGKVRYREEPLRFPLAPAAATDHAIAAA